MPKLTLAAKISAAIVLVAIATVTVAVVSFLALNKIDVAKRTLSDAAERRSLAGHAQANFLGYVLTLEQIARTSTAEETRQREARAENEYSAVSNWFEQLGPRLRTEDGRREFDDASSALVTLRSTQSSVQMLTHIGDVKAAEDLLSRLEAMVVRGKESLRSIEKRNGDWVQEASAQVSAAQQDAKGQIALVGVIGISIALLMAFWIVLTQVTQPLTALADAVKKLAGGDTDVVLPKATGSDEIAEMTRCVATFRENAIQIKEHAAEEQTRKQASAAERQALVQKLAEDFDHAVSSVIAGTRSAAEKLSMSATALESAAHESSQQAVAVSQAAQEASMNVSTVATAAEQLNSSVTEVARQVAQSNAIAERATAEANRTTENVRAQSEAARRIGDVVDMINTLAAQTNLLALNATIEAARAGDAGRGFAVVASEVKSLAEQTAKATDQIAEQVRDIRATTDISSTSINEIVTTISSMAGISSAIAAAIEQQRASTEEIARNVREASRGTDEVSSNIEQVSGASIRTGDAAGEVRTLAETIAQQANTLRGSVDHFLFSMNDEKQRAA